MRKSYLFFVALAIADIFLGPAFKGICAGIETQTPEKLWDLPPMFKGNCICMQDSKCDPPITHSSVTRGIDTKTYYCPSELEWVERSREEHAADLFESDQDPWTKLDLVDQLRFNCFSYSIGRQCGLSPLYWLRGSGARALLLYAFSRVPLEEKAWQDGDVMVYGEDMHHLRHGAVLQYDVEKKEWFVIGKSGSGPILREPSTKYSKPLAVFRRRSEVTFKAAELDRDRYPFTVDKTFYREEAEKWKAYDLLAFEERDGPAGFVHVCQAEEKWRHARTVWANHLDLSREDDMGTQLWQHVRRLGHVRKAWRKVVSYPSANKDSSSLIAAELKENDIILLAEQRESYAIVSHWQLSYWRVKVLAGGTQSSSDNKIEVTPVFASKDTVSILFAEAIANHGDAVALFR